MHKAQNCPPITWRLWVERAAEEDGWGGLPPREGFRQRSMGSDRLLCAWALHRASFSSIVSTSLHTWQHFLRAPNTLFILRSYRLVCLKNKKQHRHDRQWGAPSFQQHPTWLEQISWQRSLTKTAANKYILLQDKVFIIKSAVAANILMRLTFACFVEFRLYRVLINNTHRAGHLLLSASSHQSSTPELLGVDMFKCMQRKTIWKQSPFKISAVHVSCAQK